MTARNTRLLILLTVAVGLGLHVWLGPTVIGYARWRAASHRVLPTVQAALAADNRFADLTAFVSSAGNVVVFGNVASEQDKHALPAVLGDVEFPHGVVFLVRAQP